MLLCRRLFHSGNKFALCCAILRTYQVSITYSYLLVSWIFTYPRLVSFCCTKDEMQHSHSPIIAVVWPISTFSPTAELSFFVKTSALTSVLYYCIAFPALATAENFKFYVSEKSIVLQGRQRRSSLFPQKRHVPARVEPFKICGRRRRRRPIKRAISLPYRAMRWRYPPLS